MYANENGASRQAAINRAVYESRGAYRHYLSQLLTPAEIVCLLKYQCHISGHDVLDIGVGAGRTTRYLAPFARRYEAIDYSSMMVSMMKRAMPEINVHQADFKDLTIFDDSSFDFVFATSNVIDTLPHEDRLQALREVNRVLRTDGILAFSSHNIHYKGAFRGPQLEWSSNPIRLAYNCAQYLVCLWNHIRVGPLRKITPDYALLNDPGHYYACLHYYVGRSTVNSQLMSVGLRLSEVFETQGRVAPEFQDDSDHPSLFYIARRAA